MSVFADVAGPMVDLRAVSDRRSPPASPSSIPCKRRADPTVAIDPNQEFLVQPVDASWLQCNIECQEACPVGTNCRGYLNLAAEGRFEEGYILSREPNPVAAMCAYVCSAPCERACRRGDIDRPLAIRAMKRFLVEWHAASGIPDDMPAITPRDTTVAVVGAGPAGPGRRPRAGRRRPPGRRLRRAALRRRHDAHRRARLPPAARGDRDGRPPHRAPGRDLPLRHPDRPRHHLRAAPGAVRRDRHLRRGHGRRAARRPRRRPRRHPVRRRLHAQGQPRRAARGGPRRGRHRWRLHGHGLLAHQPPPRRRERHHRLPPHPLGAGRRRGGAGRDGARGRPHGVPGQPGRADRRGRPAHRRADHPQPARRAGRHRPPRARPDPGHRVRGPGRDGHPGRQPGRRQHVPAGRVELRDQPRPHPGRPGHLRHQRQGRLRLRRLRDRPHDAHRGGGPRQEVRLRHRPLPVGPFPGRDPRERARRQLLAPRDAGVLRRPPAPARAHGAAAGAHALDRPGGQLHPAGRARLRRHGRRHRVDPLPDVQLQHLVRPVPLRPLRRLRRRLPRGRHPHDRRQPDEVRGGAARAGGRVRLADGRGDGARRGALHPLRAVRQALPVRRDHDGAVRAPGSQQRRAALQGELPRRPARALRPGQHAGHGRWRR